jgi:hypothetical protein
MNLNQVHSSIALCVDLDGTLIPQDVTKIGIWKLLKQKPLYLFVLPLWLLHGRAVLKAKVAALIPLTPQDWTISPGVLELIHTEKKRGRLSYLVTAADQKYAKMISDALRCFDEVLASDGVINLRAAAKAQCLVTHFGDKNFIYVGNSCDDFKVWDKAYGAIISPYASACVRTKAQKRYKNIQTLL